MLVGVVVWPFVGVVCFDGFARVGVDGLEGLPGDPHDEDWLVAPEPPDTTMAGALKITSVRHYTGFAEMNPEEATTFGPLVSRRDEALRATTDPRAR